MTLPSIAAPGTEKCVPSTVVPSTGKPESGSARHRQMSTPNTFLRLTARSATYLLTSATTSRFASIVKVTRGRDVEYDSHGTRSGCQVDHRLQVSEDLRRGSVRADVVGCEAD